MNRPERLLERSVTGGLFLLIIVMPFHAFLSVWLGSIIGHQALIQSWKEVVLIGLFLGTIALVIREPDRLTELKTPVVYLGVAFSLIALIITLFTHPNATGVLYGAKTDLEFIALLIVALSVGRSMRDTKLTSIVIIGGVLTAIIGICLVTVLPREFLTSFGYGVTTIQPFELVDPAISAVRTPSTLGGPNQFGAYLIVPLCLALVVMIRRRSWRYAVASALMGVGVFISYSRAALIGAVIGGTIAILISLPKRQAIRFGLSVGGILVVMGVLLAGLTGTENKISYYVLHQKAKAAASTASTSQHITAFQAGVNEILQTPFGRGLGTAGPASYHSDHPFVPESYYLQLGIETGIIGLITFVALLARLAYDLARRRGSVNAAGLTGALVGLSIVSLVLHGWADATVTYVFWILAGATLSSTREELTVVPYVTLVGVKLSNITAKAAIDSLVMMISRRQGGLVATVNAEFIVRAQSDNALRDALQRAVLTLADGSGPTIMSRLLGTPLVERIPGVDFVELLLERAAREQWRVFLLGGLDGVSNAAKTIWQLRYPGLEIVGTSEPRNAEISSPALIREIAATTPDIILVALGGSSKQELWIDNHLSETGAVIGVGVGGTFNFVTGTSVRAPYIVRRLGLEWLHRLTREPKRAKRMLALPRFVYLCLRYGHELSHQKQEKSYPGA